MALYRNVRYGTERDRARGNSRASLMGSSTVVSLARKRGGDPGCGLLQSTQGRAVGSNARMGALGVAGARNGARWSHCPSDVSSATIRRVRATFFEEIRRVPAIGSGGIRHAAQETSGGTA